MDFDLEELAAIIEQLDKTEFTEFRFEKGDTRLLVRRGPVTAGEAEERGPAPTRPQQPSSPVVAEVEHTDPARTPITPAAEDVVITAPMLGTFYRAPKPGEPAFVQAGDKVDADSVLCIVEVMKLMNSVPAGVQGEVTAVYASDGELVEFGQALFAIRPIA